MKKTTIIIDDERLARVELRRLLSAHPEIDIIGEASNADEGIEQIYHHNPDLIFLDVQIPGKTGFEMLEQLEYVPQVIFTTAYDEYAIKAFEVNALDYLLKPIVPRRLSDAISKLGNSIQPETYPAELTVSRSFQLGEHDQVFVKEGERCWFVRLSEISMFESAGNYTRIYFHSNKPLILKSLNALEGRLDEKVFFRANRKNIVNLRMIESIESRFNGGLLLHVKGNNPIEVSRRQAIRFKEMMSL